MRKAARLPPEEQDAIAVSVMEELADDRRWTATFRATSSKLAGLAEETVTELRAGRAKPMRIRRSK
jgi:hypothetical protein